MQLFQEVLVSYDVTDNRARTKLFQRLKDYGLIPIQKSVFWGRVNEAEKRAVYRLFRELLNGPDDCAFIIQANISEQMKKGGYGYENTVLFRQQEYAIL